MSTRKANAEAHPGFPDKPQPRRTSEQVKQGKARAVAAVQKKDAEHRAVVSSLAHLEDSIERGEEQRRLQANRPDLWHNPQRSINTDLEEGNGRGDSESNDSRE